MKERKDENGQTVYFRESAGPVYAEAAEIPDSAWNAVHDVEPGPVQYAPVVPTSLAEAGLKAAVSPRHYHSHPSGVECIDITEHMNFNMGNAVKYLFRCDMKDSPEENLNKALWYVRRELKRRNLSEIQ